MNDAIHHRGPDDGGEWVDERVGIGLANRRLAIIDVSSAGHQPMTSRCGRYVIVYNGEVYNFQKLSKELEHQGVTFRGHTDTEVILEACARWGLDRTLAHLNGMFAFALWDRQNETLSLVRDRIGIKPLYYARFGTTLLFGSELKALTAHPGFEADIDRDSLGLFLRYSYIPAPWTIYRDVYKLQPGHVMTFNARSLEPAAVPYWSVRDSVEHDVSRATAEEAIAELDSLLSDAVNQQMVSDVPLGGFLSGGIDSSTVVALMQAQSTRRVNTFSIGFEDKSYDEAEYARSVARHLGTDHTELYVDHKQLLDTVPHLASTFDEPFADASQIPTQVLSALTRKHVTVALSGDGGDELFAGYDHYPQLRDRWELLRRFPRPLRSISARVLEGVTGGNASGAKLATLSAVLDAESPESLGRYARSRWKAPEQVIPTLSERPTAFTDRSQWPQTENTLARLMYLDLITYLPEGVLTKVDRTSIAVSLEARVPVLDHRIVEFAMRIPVELKIRNQEPKWLLRQVLQRYVPRELFDRPKKGFSVPMSTWLRGPLRGWAETLLDVRAIQQHGILEPAPIRRKWNEHLAGTHDWGNALWNVVMFQAWYARWVS